jgi:hypothetical protein
VPELGLVLGMGRRGQWGPQATSLIPGSTSTKN